MPVDECCGATCCACYPCRGGWPYSTHYTVLHHGCTAYTSEGVHLEGAFGHRLRSSMPGGATLIKEKIMTTIWYSISTRLVNTQHRFGVGLTCTPLRRTRAAATMAPMAFDARACGVWPDLPLVCATRASYCAVQEINPVDVYRRQCRGRRRVPQVRHPGCTVRQRLWCSKLQDPPSTDAVV